MDVFLVTISIVISARFNQINERITSLQDEYVPDNFWDTVRHHYTLLTELVQFIDEEVGAFIIMSVASGMYFLCFQLFNIFEYVYSLERNLQENIYAKYFYSRERQQKLSDFYFWYSVVFIGFRIFSVLWYSTSINEHSKVPLILLDKWPTSNYGIEASRFRNQISMQNNCLTGKGFFLLTRKIFLVVNYYGIKYFRIQFRA